jgi:hypothetical protein
MRSCEKITFLIVRSEEIPLTFSEKVKLATHLCICKFCKNFEKQSAYIAKQLQNISSPVSLSAEDKLSMTEAIEKNS